MTKEDEEKKECDISDLMESFGKYQVVQYVLLCVPSMFVSMISINYIFVVADVPYRCQVDVCDNSNSTSQFPSWWPNTTIDRCSKPVLKNGTQYCTNSSFTGELDACDRWIYENNNSVISELNLGCQPFKSNMVGTIHNIGIMVSMVVAGFLADRFGRKPAMIFCMVGGCVGNLKTLASSYYTYVCVEFLEAAITGGTYTAAMVMCLEIAGNKYRVLAGVVFSFAIYFGESLIVGIAILFPYWKTINHFINGPCIIFILLIFFINESPRWQIISGRVEEAKKIMKKIRKDNKVNISDEELSNINEVKLKKYFDIKSHDVKESIIDALKSKEITKRLFVACMGRFTSNFVYYGMMINSVWLPGDKYLNFFLSTLMSFPGEILVLYLMNKVGRRIPLLVGYTVCGALVIISAFVPARYLWLKLTLFLLGKVIISGSFTGTITYALELFPTSLRGSLLGVCSFACQLGGMLAPLTPILSSVSEVVPYLLFGGAAIATGTLFCLTPETRHAPLYDTIAQLEAHARAGGRPRDQASGAADCALEALATSPE